MKNTLCTIIAICTSLLSYSQLFIDLKKNEVNEYVRKNAHEKIVSIVTVSDSTMFFLQKDTVQFSLDKKSYEQSHITTITLHFNTSGRCDSETRTYTCDVCFTKPYFKILDNKKYKWKQLKAEKRKQISEYKKGLILEIPNEPLLTFKIYKFNLSKKEYDKLLSK